MNKWEEKYLKLAIEVSSWSKDPSTKVGSVIFSGNRFISLGFNGFPKNTKDSEEYLNNRTIRIARTIHAELNAILFAKEDLEGKTLAVYPFQPCCSCAAVIVQKGIKKVIAPKMSDDIRSRWKESCEYAEQLFLEAGVELEIV